MKHTFLAFLIALWLVLPTSASAPTNSALRTFNSIVKIYADVSEGKEQCTAFAVNPITYITAAHCVENQEEVTIVKNGIYGAGHVRKLDKEHDIAMFKSDIMTEGLVLGEEPKLGDKVFAFGYPQDAPFPSFYEANALGNRLIPHFGTKFIYNREIYQGMSGGPVVDEQGKVVSINQMGSPFVSGGVVYDDLKKFLK